MNRKMKSSLGVADPVEFSQYEKLSERLSQLLAAGFTVLDAAIVFTSLRKIADSVLAENFPDLTGFECFVNHVHVEDELDGPIDSRTALLKQAIAFAVATRNQLRSLFPGEAFRVIVAATASGCGVRFHVVRPREEWLAGDLDGYGEEAILVLDS
jgi:hypothetical protein